MAVISQLFVDDEAAFTLYRERGIPSLFPPGARMVLETKSTYRKYLLNVLLTPER